MLKADFKGYRVALLEIDNRKVHFEFDSLAQLEAFLEGFFNGVNWEHIKKN